MKARTFLLACLLAAEIPVAAQALPKLDVERAWQNRDRDFPLRGEVDPGPIGRVVTFREQELAREPDDPETLLALARALYFQGHFATTEKKLQGELLDRQRSASERSWKIVLVRNGLEEKDLDHEDALARLREDSSSRDALLWTIVSEGMWAMEHRLAAGLMGSPDRLRRRSEWLLALDETYGEAAGHRILGRLHTATPKVPGFTSWVDWELGLCHLRRAWEISHEDPRNGLFLAEALLAGSEQDRENARSLLEEIAARTPHPRRLVEETETLDAARALLASLPTAEDAP